ncbi:anthranilate synthase component II [Canicola haemoglobinophilus]|uniref:anthranilate synthase n=1 Tax=Canicola haemoglobinophilus TaxID=733 RepID=A0A1V4AYY6_9PAST|nr:aminodeoxychorismate/anthranilate synthase component II [Canicola haemoglobinophilus]OOR98034.1 anthranilate synthase component II [Canicola haemoglobinophilus]STO53988.1 anthranilate synthase component II [Canicola haemoglobinophilus]STO60575.1 anthranilate synthase component II [Canicola haemoglobinophilus]STO68521.1 anthranilate synthase component II [Canicola haemoglobinophilus]
MARIIFLDNFDSFTYNLVDQFRSLGHQVQIFRNDCDLNLLAQVTLAEKNTILALSPGPGNPAQAGILLPLIEKLKGKVAMLGICLGHQALIEAFGGKVVHAGEILHGKVSNIQHDNQMMFQDLANPMPVARYHSLMGIDLPAEFVVNAEYNGIIMAIRHKTLPICSFQFHPESILTVQGSQLLAQSIQWLLDRSRG